jgi:hypothetical protein
MTYQEQTWNFLISKGLPEKSTASVMGNIQMESGFTLQLLRAEVESVLDCVNGLLVEEHN